MQIELGIQSESKLPAGKYDTEGFSPEFAEFCRMAININLSKRASAGAENVLFGAVCD
jgi:hypothetical protein